MLKDFVSGVRTKSTNHKVFFVLSTVLVIVGTRVLSYTISAQSIKILPSSTLGSILEVKRSVIGAVPVYTKLSVRVIALSSS